MGPTIRQSLLPLHMSEGTVAARAESGHLFAVCGASAVGSAPTSLDTVEQQCVEADIHSRQNVSRHNLRSGLCVLSQLSASHRRQQ